MREIKSIPKIIHYCWFGGGVKNQKILKCMASWKQILPEYKFMEWNETNIDMDSPYLKATFQAKKWSKLSNIVRLQVLLQYGGVYLDTDVEVLKPFDDLLNEHLVLGFQQKENNKDWVNNAIILSEKGHPFLAECIDLTFEHFSRTGEFLRSPSVTTAVLRDWGLVKFGNQRIKDVLILKPEYFYPFPYWEQFHSDVITDNTYCVHMFDYSWGVPMVSSGRFGHLHKLKRAFLCEANKVFIKHRILTLGVEYLKTLLSRLLNRPINVTRSVLLYSRARIIAGPFKGIRFFRAKSGSAFCPKLLGTYEMEIQPWICEIVERKYQNIINLGCGEGYYAVGLAYKCPDASVFAFDLNETAQKLTQALAQTNGVESRVCVRGKLDWEALEYLPILNSLVLCDIEGAEAEMLDTSKAPSLLQRDILVELHDGAESSLIRELMFKRFGLTHDIEWKSYQGRKSKDCPPELHWLSIFSRQSAVEEYRLNGIEWAFIRRKTRNLFL